MSRLRRLLCPLPVLVASLLAVGGRAHGGQVAPDVEPLVDVKPDSDVTLPAELAGNGEQTWVMSWDDFVDDAAVSSTPLSARAATSASLADPTKPVVIAAPLPPAIISGLIGLATVYAYRRRNRLR